MNEFIYPYRKLEVEDDKVYEKYIEDVAPVLKYTKAMREETDMHSRRKGDMWHIASLPMSVVIDIKTKHGYDIFKDRDPAKLMAIIDQHYPYLKTM